MYATPALSATFLVTNDPRAQYRVAGPTLADVEASICLDALALSAHLLDLSADGAGLVLDPVRAAEMKRVIVDRRPQSLSLSLSLPGLDSTFSTPVTTRYVSWGAEGTRVGLAFRLARDRLLDLAPPMRTLLNQRGVVRVPIISAQPLPLRVEGIAGDLIAEDVLTRDISLGGVGASVAPGVEFLLPAGREVRLTLGIRPQPITLRAVVRHSAVARDRMPWLEGAPSLARVGFAFDPAEIAHPRTADRLANEVMRRQLDARKTAAPR